jgi:hypothetical protein
VRLKIERQIEVDSKNWLRGLYSLVELNYQILDLKLYEPVLEAVPIAY